MIFFETKKEKGCTRWVLKSRVQCLRLPPGEKREKAQYEAEEGSGRPRKGQESPRISRRREGFRGGGGVSAPEGGRFGARNPTQGLNVHAVLIFRVEDWKLSVEGLGYRV